MKGADEVDRPPRRIVLPDGVRAVVRVTIARGAKRFGVVSLGNEIASWAWFIGNQGVCLWTVGGSPLPIGLTTVPFITSRCADKDSYQLLAEVDAVLVQGSGQLPLAHALWTLPSVQVIVWVAARTRGGQRNAPDGWRSFTRVFFHARLGGVTDGRFLVGYAIRSGADVECRNSAELFPNFLAQIWSPTVSGRLVKIPTPDTPSENTTRGLLIWETRASAFVAGPTVFSKANWVTRRLTVRERADALDMPADKFKQSTPEWQAVMAAQTVPGKVLAQAISVISWDHMGAAEREAPVPYYSNVAGSTNEDCLINPIVDSEADGRGLGKRRYGSEEGEGKERGKKRRRVQFRLPVAGEMDTREEDVASRGRWDALFGDALTKGTVSDKAVKSDVAGVPVELWNRRVLEGTRVGWAAKMENGSVDQLVQALDVIRAGALQWWKRHVLKSFVVWFRKTEHGSSEENELILDAGRKALFYVGRCSWWEWSEGSGILFWRWPLPYQREMREGVPPMFVGAPPSSMDRQPPYTCDTVRNQVKDKVGTVVARGYIELVERVEDVQSLMYMFHVPKGADDVRMVYDGSKSGLNEALFAPWFHIHTVDMMCRSLLPGYWCADNDYGEQFLNFNLHPMLQKLCGVDLTQLMGKSGDPNGDPRKETMGKWTRCAMGLRPSPYVAVKGALIARRLILGDRRDVSNPFAWAGVRLNQPGDPAYRPDLPWLMLVRVDGALATSVCQYIDDLRTCAKDEATAWAGSCRIAKVLGWLGLQDAARKRREPSQEPGAWSGATVVLLGGNVFQSVTAERWVKTQQHIRRLAASIGLVDAVSAKVLSEEELIEAMTRTSTSPIDHKKLESSRGFLVYVSNTYRAMIPYLKGIHLTVDSWRTDRDDEGWRLSYKMRQEATTACIGQGGEVVKPPREVFAAARLSGDLEVLLDFTSGDSAPKIPVRSTKSVSVYMVGDASGTGFGGSTWEAGAEAIGAIFGGWDERVMRESSNFREALNLVLMIEMQVKAGELIPGTEVFVFTDNSTAERAFNKGTSSSKKLHELVVRLRKMEMSGYIAPRFVWISGERMIAQGTDGLSRGDLTCGVMKSSVSAARCPARRIFTKSAGLCSLILPSSNQSSSGSFFCIALCILWVVNDIA